MSGVITGSLTQAGDYNFNVELTLNDKPFTIPVKISVVPGACTGIDCDVF